jgi:hypothetical protein
MDGKTFDRWLDEARIPKSKRYPQQLAVLRAAFVFLARTGGDYASRRILTHFLLNCQADLKLAQVARLVGVTRTTTSRQNQLSARQVVREIQHQISGRPYGKLLPRYAGPIAQYLVHHSQATRDDLLDFIERTWNIRVGLSALYEFLKTYGLDRESLAGKKSGESPPVTKGELASPELLNAPSAGDRRVPVPPDSFFLPVANMPERSCCCPRCSVGGASPSIVSPMTTARCCAAF